MRKILPLAILIFSFSCAFAQRPLYRYYNQKIKKHYYTTDFTEFRDGTRDVRSEGMSCKVFAAGTREPGLTPVWRLLNAQTGDHYYTTARFVPGRDLRGYAYEGVAFYVFKYKVPGSIALLEYYSPSQADHFYTTDRRELGPGSEGYVFNTAIGFVYPK
jgi:hypothetical protein